MDDPFAGVKKIKATDPFSGVRKLTPAQRVAQERKERADKEAARIANIDDTYSQLASKWRQKFPFAPFGPPEIKALRTQAKQQIDIRKVRERIIPQSGADLLKQFSTIESKVTAAEQAAKAQQAQQQAETQRLNPRNVGSDEQMMGFAAQGGPLQTSRMDPRARTFDAQKGYDMAFGGLSKPLQILSPSTIGTPQGRNIAGGTLEAIGVPRKLDDLPAATLFAVAGEALGPILTKIGPKVAQSIAKAFRVGDFSAIDRALQPFEKSARMRSDMISKMRESATKFLGEADIRTPFQEAGVKSLPVPNRTAIDVTQEVANRKALPERPRAKFTPKEDPNYPAALTPPDVAKETFIAANWKTRTEGLLADVGRLMRDQAGAGRKYGPVMRELEKSLAENKPTKAILAELDDLWGAQKPAQKPVSAIKALDPPTKAPEALPAPQIAKQTPKTPIFEPPATKPTTIEAPNIVPESPVVKPKTNDVPAAPPKNPATTPNEGQGVALSNESTNAVRRLANLPEYSGVPKQTIDEWAAEASKRGYNEPRKALSIARDVRHGIKRDLDEIETVGLASALDNLANEFDDVSKRYADSLATGGDLGLARRVTELTESMSEIADAANKAGTRWGRSGAARQAMMKADGSFTGVLARRQQAAGRNLTEQEITTLRQQVNDLQTDRDALAARVKEFESGKLANSAQAMIDNHVRSAPRTVDKVARANARLQEASERLKLKWAETKPEATIRSSALFGAEIAAEQAARVAKVAPEIIELVKVYAELNVTKLADNVAAVVKHLKSVGIEDVSDNDVAAVIAGKIRGESEIRASRTAYEGIKKEAAEAFRVAREDREAWRKQLKAQADATEKATLDAAKAQLKAEEKAAREAELAFWKEVMEDQREFDSTAREAARLDREEAIRRWKASAQGRRAAAMNRLDDIQERLDFVRKEGTPLGSKTDLPDPDDPVLNDLKIKVASKERQLRMEEHRYKQQRISQERTPLEKATEAITSQLPGTFRNALAMGDLSWSGIQGALSVVMNPRAWSEGLVGSGKALFQDADQFAAAMESLRSKGIFDKIEASGVDLPGLRPGHYDEFFAETFADKLPLYGTIRKRSGQAYEGAATITRAGLVETWIKSIESSGRPLDLDGLKVLGDAANTLTGKASGPGGKLVSSWPAAGKTIFAPSWWLSQFQGMTGKPIRDALNYGFKSGDWRPAKLMSKEYAKVAVGTIGTLHATGLAVNQAHEQGLTDWQIGLDPFSNKYGKVYAERDGTTITVDFLPPQISAPIKFTAQSLFGSRKEEGDDLQRSGWNRKQVLGNTFEGKYAPGPRIAFGISDSMNATDKKTAYPFGRNMDPRTGEGIKNLGIQSLSPIAWQQGFTAGFEEKLSPSERAILGFLSLFGRGPNIYKKSD